MKDKFIITTNGNYKVRKNGREALILEPGTDKEERVKVTPILEEIEKTEVNFWEWKAGKLKL